MLSRRLFWRGAMHVPSLVSRPVAAADSRSPQMWLSLHDVEPRAGKSLDNTEAFARAIEAVHQRRLGTLWIPPGEYPLRSLQLRDCVAVRGAGRESTVLQALAGNDPGFVTIQRGPVRHTGLVGLTLRGGTREKAKNAQQWALYVVARAAPSGHPHGGMWYSGFEDLNIENFDRGISLEGGGNNYLLPHQFFSMRDIVVDLAKSASGPSLSMSGQVAQGLFQQCLFDGASLLDKPAIHLRPDNGGDVAPALHHFDVCTIQTARLGILIEQAQNIALSNCWFENVHASIRVAPGSYGISITGNRFANAGEAAPAITFEPDTSGTISGNVYAGDRTREPAHVASDAKVSGDGGTSIWGAGRSR
jgi:hypothetical protein